VIVRAPDTVHPVEHFDWRKPVLVVPLDGSSEAEAALPVARRFAQALDGRVILASVIADPTLFVDGYSLAESSMSSNPDADEAALREYLEKMAEVFTNSGIPNAICVRNGDPAAEIAQLAQQQNAAAILMSTHGRTGLVRAVLGSVAGKVVHVSTSPVILVRPGSDQLVAQSKAPIAEVAPSSA
jgi:nucleotide-binding universal stress UspA family protein